ncbi:uroporphyrinogen-III C-methyltransferase [Rhodanobacter sp. ANJX3]|uniref:uroporphyrinogen-III C-methyltransferase n=1 Tax=Rhodanobacter sp. ANJX3 TaxID=2723083 RepID=UPI002105444B|nr:uroporphyrinogen-III C-methyltransferase [Rhodanobacter sp. ANJX3]
MRPVPAKHEPGSRGGGTLALAVLLALIAIGGTGYVGWRQWQQAQVSTVDSRNLATLQQRVAALETTLSGVSGERTSLNQRLSDADQVNRSLREELLGQAERTRNLEDAVAKLAQKSLSGQDATLLDETESLLRMAGERYTLFHDAQGAVAAYTLADQTLAGVNDATFAGLRQSITVERDALVKSQPASQASALQQLTELRGDLATLPLKTLDSPTSNDQSPTVWQRIKQALASVISVQRSNGAPLAVADARFARELASLDLAQAQTALLAYDANAYAAALQRVDVALSSQFDDSNPDVQQARVTLKQLGAALPPSAPVHLGAALTELRNLRTLHALKPDATGTVPAPSGSSAAPGNGVKL